MLDSKKCPNFVGVALFKREFLVKRGGAQVGWGAKAYKNEKEMGENESNMRGWAKLVVLVVWWWCVDWVMISVEES